MKAQPPRQPELTVLADARQSAWQDRRLGPKGLLGPGSAPSPRPTCEKPFTARSALSSVSSAKAEGLVACRAELTIHGGREKKLKHFTPLPVSGFDVEYLQQYLVEYDIDVDGNFGPMTLSTVRSLQSSSSLAP